MDAVWILAPVAGAMAAIIAALVRWASTARTWVAASVVAFLLAMMGSMFVGTLIYFSRPSPLALVLGFWVAGALMAASVFPVIAVFLTEVGRQSARGAEYRPRPVAVPLRFAAVVVVLVFGSELLMGRSFALAAGGPVARLPSSVGGAVVATIASPWFLFPMAAEMGLTLRWVRSSLPPLLALLFAADAAMMALSTPALPGVAWRLATGLGSAAVMSLALVALLRPVYRGRPLSAGVRRYALAFLAAASTVEVGVGVWLATGSLTVFAIGTAAQMAVFFSGVVAPEPFSRLVGPPPADSVGPSADPPGSGTRVPSTLAVSGAVLARDR